MWKSDTSVNEEGKTRNSFTEKVDQKEYIIKDEQINRNRLAVKSFGGLRKEGLA